jgi:hypothetical protein
VKSQAHAEPLPDLEQRDLGLHLLTFGGGKLSWREAAKRVAREARASGWFASVSYFTDRSLQKSFPQFVGIVPTELFAARGYGYWVWKPFLVLKMLEKLPPLQTLLYVDAGCHLNVTPESGKRLHQYLATVRATGELLMEIRGAHEIEWTKRRVLEALAVSGDDLESDQIASGAFFLQRNEQNLALCHDWLGCARYEDFSLIDDRLGDDESPRLRAHRHDQSLWSCLTKRTTIARIPDETYWFPEWVEQGFAYPIWSLRHRSGTDPTQHGLIAGVARRAEALGNRLNL